MKCVLDDSPVDEGTNTRIRICFRWPKRTIVADYEKEAKRNVNVDQYGLRAGKMTSRTR